jgi:hypothetical protein
MSCFLKYKQNIKKEVYFCVPMCHTNAFTCTTCSGTYCNADTVLCASTGRVLLPGTAFSTVNPKSYNRTGTTRALVLHCTTVEATSFYLYRYILKKILIQYLYFYRRYGYTGSTKYSECLPKIPYNCTGYPYRRGRSTVHYHIDFCVYVFSCRKIFYILRREMSFLS